MVMLRINILSHLKKEKRNLLLLLFLFFISVSYISSQSPSDLEKHRYLGDSLFLLSKEETKVGNFSIAFQSAKKSLELFEQLDDNKSIGNCYKQMATIDYYRGNFSKSLTNFESGKFFFEKANFVEGVASTINNKGAIYYYLGNLPQALDHYQKAIKLHEGLGNDMAIAGTTQNIGNIYLQLDDLQNAELYFEKAKNIYENEGDEKAVSLVLSSLGSVYMKEMDYVSALNTLTVSLNLAIKLSEKQIQTECYYNLGKLFEIKDIHLDALKNYNQSLKISQETKNYFHESSALIAIGSLQLKLKNRPQALVNCKLGLDLAKKIEVISVQEEACKCLYNYYKSLNLANKALEYIEEMHFLRDSLNLKQTADNMLHMEFEKQILLDSIIQVEKDRKVLTAYNEVISRKQKQRNIFILTSFFILLITGGVYSRLNFVKKSKAILQIEKDRSEHLLLNILPFEIAEELKEKGFVNAQDIETATILFTDFKSFTETATLLSPQELVEEINVYFKAFDGIIEFYNIEKIKTIGDAYMAVGGLQSQGATAARNTILAALAMQTFVTSRKEKNNILGKPAFEMRVGIHVGPIVAGIVGLKKFQYDVWGDTVNTASRMESNSAVGKVNISHSTYQLVELDEDFLFEYRGKIEVKGKGGLKMYFVSLDND